MFFNLAQVFFAIIPDSWSVLPWLGFNLFLLRCGYHHLGRIINTTQQCSECLLLIKLNFTQSNFCPTVCGAWAEGKIVFLHWCVRLMKIIKTESMEAKCKLLLSCKILCLSCSEKCACSSLEAYVLFLNHFWAPFVSLLSVRSVIFKMQFEETQCQLLMKARHERAEHAAWTWKIHKI